MDLGIAQSMIKPQGYSHANPNYTNSIKNGSSTSYLNVNLNSYQAEKLMKPNTVN